jgi:transposase-like protein
MGQFPKSFKVYGFTIKVHAGGRRVWPPSFKRFVKEGLDNGKLSLADVMKQCNVSQSLVYKWRADVKAARIRNTTVTEDTFFSEVVVDEELPVASLSDPARGILLRGRAIEVTLPFTYPVKDLIKIIRSLEACA